MVRTNGGDGVELGEERMRKEEVDWVKVGWGGVGERSESSEVIGFGGIGCVGK
jgi:hypothetical protein